MSNFFYARKSKGWQSEKQDHYIFKLGSTQSIEFRKWWGSTERLYPTFYAWYIQIHNLGNFPSVISAEKTIFRHHFFKSRHLDNGEGSGEEFYEFKQFDNPLEKACEILIQYNAEFSVIHGDTFTTRPPILPIEEKMILSQPLPPITKVQTKSMKIREYQRQALEKMSDVDKGVLILATGTGKTVIYSLYIQKFKGRYLIVVPTITLVNQTFEKCREIIGEDFSFLIYETGMILPSRSNCKNLVLIGTYQNSHNMIDLQDIDCIFFDECHSTVINTLENSVSDLSRFQKLLNHPCKKKFFGTATEKNIISTTQKPISMDDEKIYGPILYKYSLSEAITQGYLTDYTFDLIGTLNKKESCISYIKSRFKSIIFCSNLKIVDEVYQYLYESLKTTTIKVFKLGEGDDIKINTDCFSQYHSQAVIVC